MFRISETTETDPYLVAAIRSVLISGTAPMSTSFADSWVGTDVGWPVGIVVGAEVGFVGLAEGWLDGCEEGFLNAEGFDVG